jgi:hypothetical protein
MAIAAINFSGDLPPDVIDAGSRVDVVAGGKRIADDVPVAAVRCRTTCAALVVVPEKTALEITAEKNVSAVPVGAQTKGVAMDAKSWQDPTTVEISTTPAGLWTKAVEFVPAGTVLKLEVDPSAAWRYSNQHQRTCGPDGEIGAAADSGLLMPEAPVGAVIGKIGGSSAGKSDGTQFVVGAFALLTVAQDKSGPLFLTMNVNPAHRPATNDRIGVSVFEARR